MVYATELIQQYRLALRDLWNVHFWSNESLRDWESVRQFNELKLPLFGPLVKNRLAPDLPQAVDIFGEAFKVVPRITAGLDWKITSLFVDIGFQDRPGRCWKQIAGRYSAKELTLTLIDFFDWEELSWRDFRYYRVHIEAFEGETGWVGRQGLIENTGVDVLWDSPEILGLPRQTGPS